MQQVKAVVAKAKGAPVEVVTINVPDPGPGEAVVKVQACGVCHTDLHYREGGINDDFPFLLGHEAAGVVESVGEGVTGLEAGRLRRPQLARRLRQLPRVRPRRALVLLRHPQRHAEDDPGGRHRADPRAGHRLLRGEDARRRRPVHQGRPRGPTRRGGPPRLRRDGRPRRRDQHRQRDPRQVRRGHRLRRRRHGRHRRLRAGRGVDDHRRRHRRHEARLGARHGRHPHRQLARSPSPSRPSRPSPAATAPTSSSTRSVVPRRGSRRSTPATWPARSCWSAYRPRT